MTAARYPFDIARPPPAVGDAVLAADALAIVGRVARDHVGPSSCGQDGSAAAASPPSSPS